jgi:hypothetical protein
MKDLYIRFNISIDQNRAINIFKNKIENILCSGLLGENIFGEESNDIYWELCNRLGIEYTYRGYASGKVSHVFSDLDFSEYLLRLQVLVDLVYENDEENANNLIGIIKNAIDSSPVDLGIRIKHYKKKNVQILFSGSKLLDSKLVDDVLGVLEDNKNSAIKLAFEKGIKEFMESNNNILKLKNTVRDMQLACDETIKVLYKDKNLGFRHLFKNDRWKKLGLNDYQKNIFWNLNEYIDKFAKHKSDSIILHKDAENIVYLTGLFIRFVFIDKN